MTADNKKTAPEAGTSETATEQIVEYSSATDTTSLSQKFANIILGMILDTRFSERPEVIDAKELSVTDVEEICRRFNLPLAEVLEIAMYEVKP